MTSLFHLKNLRPFNWLSQNRKDCLSITSIDAAIGFMHTRSTASRTNHATLISIQRLAAFMVKLILS